MLSELFSSMSVLILCTDTLRHIRKIYNDILIEILLGKWTWNGQTQVHLLLWGITHDQAYLESLHKYCLS